MKKRWVLLTILAVMLLAGGMALVPPVRQRIELQWITWRSDLYYRLNPPEKEVFVPEAAIAQAVAATMAAMHTSTPGVTAAPSVEATTTPAASEATRMPTAKATLAPLPASIRLQGAKHEYQQWNNCGPATLAMALSYWGWEGSQSSTAGWIKPNPRDKNTSPEELAAFAQSETWLKAIIRVGGELDTLKRLVNSGFPVIIERGFDGYDNEGWMGHYELVTGYDDSWQRFITQDALIMADFPMPYEEMLDYWKDFNRIFIVVYPSEREPELMSALGDLADEQQSSQAALSYATVEITSAAGRELFFAWFNAGSNQVRLGDFTAAASAYDQAFAVYAQLPEEERPWRMMWYQHGPYPAYFDQHRYQDILNLTSQTLTLSVEPALEESFYWRAQAKFALGDPTAAVSDLQQALKWHPNWSPALDALNAIEPAP